MLSDMSKRKIIYLLSVYVSVLLLGLIDYLTGPFLSIVPFYLIPMFFATWYYGNVHGYIVAILSAILWAVVEPIETGYFKHNTIFYWNIVVKTCFFLIFNYLMIRLKTELEHVKQLARTDWLTGVPNRKAFYEFAAFEVNRAKRNNEPITIAYIDIDDFKFINDFLGHKGGDEILCLIANTIKDNIRETDIVGRIGGDEFSVLFPATNKEKTEEVCNRLKMKLYVALKEKNFNATVSIGVVTFLKSPDSIDEMLKVADNVMYAGKSSGKNAINYVVR